VKDNELPNDDMGSVDEDNTPSTSNGYIYSYDCPSIDITWETGTYAFRIRKRTFKEWVRVQLNNTTFPTGESVQGSRASHKVQWYMLCYFKRDSSGKWIEDNTNPSYNTPVFTGIGNGTIDVTLLANAVTEGFTATYDLANLKWTLTGTSGGSTSKKVKNAPVGTQWKLKIGNKIEVVITQVSTAFANGDKFVFSVFKSDATDGKKNEMGLGYVDVTDGP
jgi:hypothetical protein